MLVSASFSNEIGALCRMEIYPAQGVSFFDRNRMGIAANWEFVISEPEVPPVILPNQPKIFSHNRAGLCIWHVLDFLINQFIA